MIIDYVVNPFFDKANIMNIEEFFLNNKNEKTMFVEIKYTQFKSIDKILINEVIDSKYIQNIIINIDFLEVEYNDLYDLIKNNHKKILIRFSSLFNLEEINEIIENLPKKICLVIDFDSLNKAMISPLVFFRMYFKRISLYIISDTFKKIPTFLLYGENNIEKILSEVILKKKNNTILIDNNFDIFFDEKKNIKDFRKKIKNIIKINNKGKLFKEKTIKKDMLSNRLAYLYELLSQINVKDGSNYNNNLESLYKYELDTLLKIFNPSIK